MTDSDAKEWVTIKVPKAVRDDAREDPRTYGDIMRDGLDEPTDGNVGVDVDAIAERIADRVEDTGGVGPEQIAREVSRQMDYAQLAGKVGEELEERLR